MLLRSVATFAFSLLCSSAFAESLKIGIMQAQKGEAAKYAPMQAWLAKKGIDVSIVGFANYSDAAKQVAEGKVDATVAGSGLAGVFLVKGIAIPLARAKGKDGNSTYWATVVAPKGTTQFAGAKSFEGKKVACSGLASSGEFFVRSLGKKDAVVVASHEAALDMVERGLVDFAVVKNRVWDKKKGSYSKMEEVGKDSGMNPDNTFMISAKIAKPFQDKVKAALLGIGSESTSEATALKESLGVTEFIPTEKKDFVHTLELLRKAGVDAKFDFKF